MNRPFEWDARKATLNLRKHGVGFAEAATVFYDPLVAMDVDADHSFDERRYRAIGHSSSQRLLVVTYTERGGVIRLIGARPADRSERRSYENG